MYVKRNLSARVESSQVQKAFIYGVRLCIANLIFRVIRTSDVTACGASELCNVYQETRGVSTSDVTP